MAEAECNRCKTRASLPLDAICRRRDTPLWKLRHYSNVVMAKGPVRAAGPHDIKLTETRGITRAPG